MPSDQLPAHVRGLLKKGAYPHPVDRVELVQTHISYVFLADEDVYKLRKAVDLGFVDFTSLEKRRRDCEAEVRLNQRGCPSVYLGVEPVTRQANRYRLGGEGEVVDYATHMKRLPREGMMDRLLAQGSVDFDLVGRLAARVAEFHRGAERGQRITRRGGVRNHARNWDANLSQMQRFLGRTLGERRFRRIEALARAFLRDEAGLLRRRERDGWIRDCHGDMRSDSICFDPSVPGGICIYDCIEFNDAFRYSDTGLDAAFLAMDLDFRGRRDLSDLFVGLYAAAIGDKELPLLLDFYKCYRAGVRGIVESLLLDDPEVAARQKTAARRRAQAYFRLTEEYARRPHRQGLVLVMGPSGSGKSVLAGSLAARLGAVLLSTDMLRRELFPEREARAALDSGVYTHGARRRVYEELERQTEAYIRAGRAVVVDGTFIERRRRGPVLGIADATRGPLLVVECKAPDEVVRQRQERRAGEAWTTSEGRYEVYEAQKAAYEPPEEVPPAHRVAVDTTQPLEEQTEAVLGRLAQIVGT